MTNKQLGHNYFFTHVKKRVKLSINRGKGGHNA